MNNIWVYEICESPRSVFIYLHFTWRPNVFGIGVVSFYHLFMFAHFPEG